METNIKIIAQRLNRLRLSPSETETEAFSLSKMDGGKCNGCEFYGTKISSSSGRAILVHNPMNGDWTRALVIPEEQFTSYGHGNLEMVEQALEWFADTL